MFKGRVSYLILAFALIMLVLKYTVVMADGYDTFEGMNDPEADWLNYLTYTTLAFVVARHKPLWWAVAASTVLAIVAEGIRQLIIITAFASTLRWPSITHIFWQNYTMQAVLLFIIALVVGAVLGILGGLLARQPLLLIMNKARSAKRQLNQRH